MPKETCSVWKERKKGKEKERTRKRKGKRRKEEWAERRKRKIKANQDRVLSKIFLLSLCHNPPSHSLLQQEPVEHISYGYGVRKIRI